MERSAQANHELFMFDVLPLHGMSLSLTFWGGLAMLRIMSQVGDLPKVQPPSQGSHPQLTPGLSLTCEELIEFGR